MVSPSPRLGLLRDRLPASFFGRRGFPLWEDHLLFTVVHKDYDALADAATDLRRLNEEHSFREWFLPNNGSVHPVTLTYGISYDMYMSVTVDDIEPWCLPEYPYLSYSLSLDDAGCSVEAQVRTYGLPKDSLASFLPLSVSSLTIRSNINSQDTPSSYTFRASLPGETIRYNTFSLTATVRKETEFTAEEASEIFTSFLQQTIEQAFIID